MSSKRKPRPRQLIPTGPTNMLSRRQRQRVQAYGVAMRMIPSGNRTAHNVQVLTEFILGDDDAD